MRSRPFKLFKAQTFHGIEVTLIHSAPNHLHKLPEYFDDFATETGIEVDISLKPIELLIVEINFHAPLMTDVIPPAMLNIKVITSPNDIMQCRTAFLPLIVVIHREAYQPFHWRPPERHGKPGEPPVCLAFEGRRMSSTGSISIKPEISLNATPHLASLAS